MFPSSPLPYIGYYLPHPKGLYIKVFSSPRYFAVRRTPAIRLVLDDTQVLAHLAVLVGEEA